jgi:tripartite-type tricarboxylate transporter receptor subunit TctC
LPGFNISSWYGLWLPRGTPKNITAKLNAAVIEAVADPIMRARLADLAQETFPRDQQTPEALGAFQKAEIEKTKRRTSRLSEVDQLNGEVAPAWCWCACARGRRFPLAPSPR